MLKSVTVCRPMCVAQMKAHMKSDQKRKKKKNAGKSVNMTVQCGSYEYAYLPSEYNNYYWCHSIQSIHFASIFSVSQRLWNWINFGIESKNRLYLWSLINDFDRSDYYYWLWDRRKKRNNKELCHKPQTKVKSSQKYAKESFQ